MLQIIYNYLIIFILPFLVGLIARFVIQKSKKPFILTICLIVFAVFMWVIAYVVPNYGDEGNGLRALQASCSAIGALIAGLITRVRQIEK